MESKLILIVAECDAGTAGEVHEVVTRCFSRWWHHMGRAWIVATRSAEWADSEVFRGGLSETRRLVCEIVGEKPGALEGFLPTGAWNWIKREALRIAEALSDAPHLSVLYELADGRPDVGSVAKADALVRRLCAEASMPCNSFEFLAVRNRAVREYRELAGQRWAALYGEGR